MIGCWAQTFDQSALGLMPDRQASRFLASLVWDRLFGRSSTRLRAAKRDLFGVPPNTSSGDPEANVAGCAGVDVVLSHRAEGSLLDWIPVDRCLCAVRLTMSVKESPKGEPDRYLFVVCAYTPTNCSSDTIKDKFNDALNALLRRVISSDITVVAGIMNAQVGRFSASETQLGVRRGLDSVRTAMRRAFGGRQNPGVQIASGENLVDLEYADGIVLVFEEKAQVFMDELTELCTKSNLIYFHSELASYAILSVNFYEMGRRRSANKPPPKRKAIQPLDKVFNCPFCNHGRSCEVVLLSSSKTVKSVPSSVSSMQVTSPEPIFEHWKLFLTIGALTSTRRVEVFQRYFLQEAHHLHTYQTVKKIFSINNRSVVTSFKCETAARLKPESRDTAGSPKPREEQLWCWGYVRTTDLAITKRTMTVIVDSILTMVILQQPIPSLSCITLDRFSNGENFSCKSCVLLGRIKPSQEAFTDIANLCFSNATDINRSELVTQLSAVFRV
ncbi:transcription elongation factor 1 homolog [Clonorchis sinensis]|uniref:Transcription elongation factor 1 homolog n=1 Tax=Clonorchis sinensis TaxID=79923 RepID=G7YPC7_CLOSI|nr:transcription elongation factor 1 homolog [Clonorchis sinensis]